MANRVSTPSALAVFARWFSVLWAVPFGALGLLLLAVATTWDGRLFGFGALLAGLLPLLASIAWRKDERLWWRATGICGAAWLLVAGAVLLRVPRGIASSASRIRHVYADGHRSFPQFAPGNLLPECDQLMLGFTLMPALDPLLTNAQAGSLKHLTAAIYAEMDSDPDFRALGSVMTEPYAEMVGFPFETGHSYVYVPAALNRGRPSPVLVFFHGSGGCFKAYLWILSKVADRTGSVLVAPSCGLGNWHAAESESSLRSALASASRFAAIDREQVHLIGLSNGGLAVSQLGAESDLRFRSLVLVSPVFDEACVGRGAFADPRRRCPVLVLTGDADDRIPVRYVRENVTAMADAGVDVRLRTVPGADHFLFFSHRELLVEALSARLKEVGRP